MNLANLAALGSAVLNFILQYGSMILDFVWGLALLIFGAYIPSLYTWVRWKIFINPKFRKVFMLKPNTKLNCILPSVTFPEYNEPEYIAYTTPFESVQFFKTLPIFAGLIGIETRDCNICLSEMVSDNEMQDNVLCLGGPIHNRLCKQVLETHTDQVAFEKHDLVSVRSGKRYSAVIRSSKIVADTALMIVAPNPWTEGGRLVILAGCRGYASIGAFNFISSRTGIIKLSGGLKKINASSIVYAIISTQVDHLTTNTIKYSKTKFEEIWAA